MSDNIPGTHYQYLRDDFDFATVGISSLYGALAAEGMHFTLPPSKGDLVLIFQLRGAICRKEGKSLRREFQLPSFNPDSSTIPRLQTMLVEHGISYPSGCNKKFLVKLVTDNLDYMKCMDTSPHGGFGVDLIWRVITADNVFEALSSAKGIIQDKYNYEKKHYYVDNTMDTSW